MEQIEYYRDAAYKNHFDFMTAQITFPDNRAELGRLLGAWQDRNPYLKRLTLRDVDSVMRNLDRQHLDTDFTYKIVIQKANLDVCKATVSNGVTTRLLFLFLNSDLSWQVYGCAKARYNDLSVLNVRDGHSLGYSLHASLHEKQNESSSEISDTAYIVDILERMKERNATPLRV